MRCKARAPAYDCVDKARANDPMLRPASDYAGVLQDTNFSGHVKSANLNQLGEIEEALLLPSAYIANASEQTSFATKNNQMFPGAGTPFDKTASADGAVVGTSSLLTVEAIRSINNGISNILPKVG